MIQFNATREDRILAHKIAHRAVNAKLSKDRLSTEMDIVATHVNGCPLDLQKLLDADAFNFFRPRYVKRHESFCAPGKPIDSWSALTLSGMREVD